MSDEIVETALKILVVDDNVMMRSILINYLKERGVQDIRTADNGSLALQMIEEAKSLGAPYDIVFLDWNMPGTSGFEVLSQCRNNPKHGKMAIVMVTAENKQRSVLEAIKAGATAYMIKPVSKAEMDTKFSQVCSWLKASE